MAHESSQSRPAVQPAGESAADKPVSDPAPRRIRWRSGLAILVLGAIAEAIVLTLYADDATLKVYISLKYVFSVVAGSFILWWLFWSGFNWRIRAAGVAIVLLTLTGLGLRYRIAGFTGDMVPIIAPRSEPTAEERIADYFENSPPAAAVSAAGNHSRGENSDALAAAELLQITADDWPRFRGAAGDGIVRGVTIRTNWDESPPQVVWKHPIGPAWSSFAVVDRWLFTQEQREEEEAVVCYEAATGRVVWIHTDETRFSSLMGGVGPRATPTIVDSRVYALGATGLLTCLDARTGELHWQTNILEDAGTADEPADNLDWGMAGSPLVFDDTVVVNPGGSAGKSVIAYDRLTGELKWASGRHRAGYAAPRLETIRGERQIVIYDGMGVAGHDPADGRELWRFPWTNSDRINVVQPIVSEESLVFFGSGYGAGSALVEIEAGDDGQWSAALRWETPGRFKLKFNDPVYQAGYLYGLDEGILSCIEFATGKRMWKRGRYGHGQILLIDDMNLLLVQAEEGNIVLVPARPDGHEEIAGFQALEGVTWNHPVVNRGMLYVRNFQQAACYDLRAAAPDEPDLPSAAE